MAPPCLTHPVTAPLHCPLPTQASRDQPSPHLQDVQRAAANPTTWCPLPAHEDSPRPCTIPCQYEPDRYPLQTQPKPRASLCCTCSVSRVQSFSPNSFLTSPFASTYGLTQSPAPQHHPLSDINPKISLANPTQEQSASAAPAACRGRAPSRPAPS